MNLRNGAALKWVIELFLIVSFFEILRVWEFGLREGSGIQVQKRKAKAGYVKGCHGARRGGEGGRG